MNKLTLIVFLMFNLTIFSQEKEAEIYNENFITVWNTPSNDDYISILYDGDSTSFVIKSFNLDKVVPSIVHFEKSNREGKIVLKFKNKGTYSIEIQGQFNSLRFGNVEDLKEVQQWGNNKWTSMEQLFVSANRKKLSKEKLNIVFSATDIPDLSQCNSLAGLFAFTNYNSPLIKNWDVSNVSTFDLMFAHNSSFNQNLNSWLLAPDATINGMFYKSDKFNSLKDAHPLRLSKRDIKDVLEITKKSSFITLWYIPQANYEVQLRHKLNSEIFKVNRIHLHNDLITNQVIDKDDNTKTTVRFPVAGFYALELQGSFDQVNFSNTDNIIDVIQWGKNKWKSMEWLFSYKNPTSVTEELKKSDNDKYYYSYSPDVYADRKVGNSLFYYSYDTIKQYIQNSYGRNTLKFSATDVPDLSVCKSLKGLFYNTDFNQDISLWNVSNVKDFSFTFFNAIQFNQPLNNWNMTNANNMQSMFENAISFNQPLDKWDVSNLEKMQAVFKNASKFNQPLNNWNITKLISLESIFNGASDFNQPLNKWKTKNIIIMDSLFNNAIHFNQNINSWNTDKVISLTSTFKGATSYNYPLDRWNVSNVLDMSSLFWGAVSFNQSLRSWDTSEVRYMQGIFAGAKTFNQDINSWNTSNVKTLREAFAWTTYFDQPLGNWDTSQVTDMYAIFMYASSFNQNINNWNTENVLYVITLFRDAPLYNQPLDKWNISKIKVLNQVFTGAKSFDQNINNWNTSSVWYLGELFDKAYMFNQPLDKWDTSKVTGIAHIFSKTYSFNQNLSPWNLDKVLDYRWYADDSGIESDNFMILERKLVKNKKK